MKQKVQTRRKKPKAEQISFDLSLTHAWHNPAEAHTRGTAVKAQASGHSVFLYLFSLDDLSATPKKPLDCDAHLT